LTKTVQPLIGLSAATTRVHQQIQRVASAPSTTVLITGPSGAGKELVAREIHRHSSRANAEFVAINCAAFTESLLEAELFGYAPGAFTGGKPRGHEGLLAAAEGGTLLLDEIAELAPSLQAKLLRVLQERVYRRIGENHHREMDVRVIACTNCELADHVDEGSFREDLYYRINVLSIRVPTLAERREDILPIAQHYLQVFSTQLGTEPKGFATSACESLSNHEWPGNVRELRNSIERACVLARSSLIEAWHLGLSPENSRESHGSGQVESGDGPAIQLDSWNLRSAEESIIRHVLSRYEGNRSRTARELGINRTTLYNKLRRYKIEA
jgi:two-component system response regulator HydG